MRGNAVRPVRLAAGVLMAAMLAACAARVPPPAPATPRYPDFVFPAVPEALQQSPGAARVEYGWRYLQNDDLRNAEREFAAAARRSPGFYPAETGSAYVELARRDHAAALERFEAALADAPRYVPALVGRGQALLAARRDEEALAAFEQALAVDPSLADVRRRVDVLRFRSAQDVVEAARAAARGGQLEDARAAYRRALEGSPGSAFLHRELGIVERRLGNREAALAELRNAVELDPSDAASLVQIGELLEEQKDFAGALEAYRAAADIEPSEALTRRIDAAAGKDRLAKLPPEFHAIPESPQVTRGELAALIGIHLGDLLQRAEPRQVVLTDVRSHWAAPWITEAARAAVLEPFPNHTFQPRARVRRGDLAAAVSRLVLLAARDDEARRQKLLDARPRIADMGTGHLGYPAAAIAVGSGVMSLRDGERFGVTQPVSGAEAIEVIERIAAFAREPR
jgi:tetratricopeptide (TPR) repeat protein